MNGLARRKYLVLLLTLVLLLVVYPVLRDAFESRLLFGLFFTAVFLSAVLVLFTQKRLRAAALLLGLPMAAAAWTGYTLPGLPHVPVLVGFHLAAALFLVLVTATILRSIYREADVTADSIFGAFCGYLLLGVIFGHFYTVMEAIQPGSFRGLESFSTRLALDEGGHYSLTYFSFATLTTVGYGDITPARGGVQGLAIVEAVLGQFYIAALVADLIGKRISQVIDRQRSSDEDR